MRPFYVKIRSKKFIDELGIKVNCFCANVGVGESTYRKWQNGEIEISQTLLAKIDKYLRRFGY